MKAKLKRLVLVIISPLARLALRLFDEDEPWDKLDRRIPARRFGPGSYREFEWYFQGVSNVEVESIDDICLWLADCEYASDEELFNEADFWQHPRTFEHLRKGDCEDHALWAWRKLTDIGVTASFVSGYMLRGQGAGAHCWVHISKDGEDYLLEATAKNPAAMLRRIEDARQDYRPHFAVDAGFRSHGFVGYLHWLRDHLDEQANQRRSRVRQFMSLGHGGKRR